MHDTLFIIFSLLFISLLFNLILSKFKIPPIIGYILTGVVISNIFEIDKHTMEFIAEMGIVFLMFMIGLEFSPEKLKSMKKEVFGFGILEMTSVALIFGILSYYIFNIDLRISIILGFTIALSSTAIVLKLLNENHEISKPYGRASLGILLFQDIAVIPILIAISLIVNKDASVSQLIINTLLSFIIVVLFIFLFGKYIAPFILTESAKTKSDEIFILSILVVVFIAAGIAHIFNLSYSLGAFLAGMVISETKYKHQVEADLMPFRDLLLGVFFVSVGLMVDINFVINNFFDVIIFTLVVILLKAFVIYFVFKFFIKSNRVSIKLAVILSQIGEFAFVILGLLAKYELLDALLLQKLIIISVISMLLTPFIVKYIDNIADLFETESDKLDLELDPTVNLDRDGHIVIVGYNKIGQRIAKKLTKKSINYIVIERQIELVKEGLKNGDHVIFGNAANRKLLNHLGIEKASSVIITTLNEEHTKIIINNILDVNDNLNIILVTENDNIDIEEKNNIFIIDKIKTLSEKILEYITSCDLEKKGK